MTIDEAWKLLKECYRNQGLSLSKTFKVTPRIDKQKRNFAMKILRAEFNDIELIAKYFGMSKHDVYQFAYTPLEPKFQELNRQFALIQKEFDKRKKELNGNDTTDLDVNNDGIDHRSFGSNFRPNFPVRKFNPLERTGQVCGFCGEKTTPQISFIDPEKIEAIVHCQKCNKKYSLFLVVRKSAQFQSCT